MPGEIAYDNARLPGSLYRAAERISGASFINGTANRKIENTNVVQTLQLDSFFDSANYRTIRAFTVAIQYTQGYEVCARRDSTNLDSSTATLRRMPVSSDDPRDMSPVAIRIATVFFTRKEARGEFNSFTARVQISMLVYTAVDHCDADPFPV